MSRRYEDFDEFCDPENPRAIVFEDVIAAAERLTPYIQQSSIVNSHCQHNFTMYLQHKLEISHITGSFKERGILNALLCLPLDKKKTGAIVASNGNEALAFTHFAAKLNIPSYVVASHSVSSRALQTCFTNGAKVYVQGYSLAESMRFARGIARDKRLAYINSRDHPHVLAGYGTIALEILDQSPMVEAIMVPVGTGGLIAAVATVVKRLKPNCFVYGVQPECAPAFFNWLGGDDSPLRLESSIAQSINVSSPGSNAFFNAAPLVDKMLLVKENWIARAMYHYYDKEHYIVEGAAACPLAAILGNIAPELKMKHVVCVVTGGNVNPVTYKRIIERALATEGYLVKFRVVIPDSTKGIHQLHRLLGAAGYKVVDMRPEKERMEEVFSVKVQVVCETKGMDHSLELKRIVDKAYPHQSEFKNEPFSDNRACPCYIRKHANFI